jgi:hypothetical protein
MKYLMIVCNHLSHMAWYRALICTFIFSFSELPLPYLLQLAELGSISLFSQNDFILYLFYTILPVCSMMMFSWLLLSYDIIRVLSYSSCYLKCFQSLCPIYPRVWMQYLHSTQYLFSYNFIWIDTDSGKY